MKLFYYMFFLLAMTPLQPKTEQPLQEFVITPKAEFKKKMSSGALKEQIGKITKQAFDQTTALVGSLGELGCCLSQPLQGDAQGNKNRALCVFAIGTMQKDIAQLQKKYSSIVEKLIDNDKPFKKASKANLTITNSTLEQAHTQLTLCVKEVDRVRAGLIRNETASGQGLKKYAETLQSQHTALSGLLKAMATDECLKTT